MPQTAVLVIQQVRVYRHRQLAVQTVLVLLPCVLSMMTEPFGEFAKLPFKFCSRLPSISFTKGKLRTPARDVLRKKPSGPASLEDQLQPSSLSSVSGCHHAISSGLL